MVAIAASIRGAGLIFVSGKGLFYGTTGGGGVYDDGTVFSMTPSGAVTPLWAFGGTPGGGDSQAPLTMLGGTLYGSTNGGGPQVGNGYYYGTLFKLYSL